MEVHLGIKTSPSQNRVKDHTMVMKPIKMNSLWYQLQVQYVYNTPLNVYTPNLQITNSSLMSNN